MINEEKLKQDTLSKMQKLAEETGNSYREEIQRTFPQYIHEAKTALMRELKSIYEKYKKLETEGKTGSLEWIYFSFLRTSLLDSFPCYRIDFYDGRGCISEEECAGTWNHYYTFDNYYRLKQQILDVAKQQTRLTPYEIDDVLDDVSEAFRNLADDQLRQLIGFLHSEIASMVHDGSSLKIMLGEYLDDAVLAAEITGKDMNDV